MGELRPKVGDGGRDASRMSQPGRGQATQGGQAFTSLSPTGLRLSSSFCPEPTRPCPFLLPDKVTQLPRHPTIKITVTFWAFSPLPPAPQTLRHPYPRATDPAPLTLGSGFVSGAEGLSRDSCPPCPAPCPAPNLGSLFCASSHLPLCFPLRPPPPFPPSFQMEKPAPLVLLRCRKLPRGESRSRLAPPPLNGFQHAVFSTQ